MPISDIGQWIRICPHSQRLPHFELGVASGDGVHLLWQEAIGSTRGRYFIMTRQELDAQTAKEWGAVNEIVPADKLLPRAREIAEGLAEVPSLTTKYTRIAMMIVPLIPPGKSGGGKRTVIMREVVNGLMYVLSTGCQWRAIPTDLPPKSTVYDHFDLWTYDGTLQRIHHALYEQCREQAQREASPTAAIIDSQSVKSAEKA